MEIILAGKRLAVKPIAEENWPIPKDDGIILLVEQKTVDPFHFGQVMLLGEEVSDYDEGDLVIYPAQTSRPALGEWTLVNEQEIVGTWVP